MSEQQLAPPETLSPPEPVTPVAPSKAGDMVTIEPEKQSELDQKVASFVESVVELDVQSEDFKERMSAIHGMGSEEIRDAAGVSNRMLDRPTRAMETGLFDDSSNVSTSLVELRRVVEDLDPSKSGDLLQPKKLFGIFPMGNKLRDYFNKYRSSQSHINGIIEALLRSQNELREDNTAIEQEKATLWQTMGKLREYAYLGQKIDTQLEARVAELEASDPEKARVVREEMLFYVRQKVQDILTQLAVSVQGYLALDMVRKNNLELVKGVDRATTTTVSALRTAVTVAQALANQKLVLEQINALNATTSSIIESTSEMLKNQSADIQRQASSSTIELDKLKNAFGNIYEAMDMMSTFKTDALANMKTTVTTLSEEVGKAQTYIDRVQQADKAEEIARLQEGGGNVLQL